MNALRHDTRGQMLPRRSGLLELTFHRMCYTQGLALDVPVLTCDVPNVVFTCPTATTV